MILLEENKGKDDPSIPPLMLQLRKIMRIAMYTDSFYPSINGVSTAIVNLATTLANAGHDIFIQAPRFPEELDLSFLPANIEVHFVKSIPIKVYPDNRIGSGLPLSLQAIRRFKPDIIHIHTPASIGIEGTLIAKALRIPAVNTFHTYFMSEDIIRIVGINNQQLLKLIQRGGWRFNASFCNRFDGLITPTNSVAEDLKKHGVNKPIFVASNILDESVYAPRTDPPNNKLTKLLYVGRLSKEKRIDLTLYALAELLKVDPDYELILIGDGPERHRLFDLSVELGIAQAVTWYGSVNHAKLIDEHLYHLGDIFVVSSKFETQGLSTLEAMAHGLPVVAIRSDANSEVIGQGGVVVPNWNDQERLVKALAKAIISINDNSQQPYHELAYQQALKFSRSALLNTYTSIYQEVIESSGK